MKHTNLYTIIIFMHFILESIQGFSQASLFRNSISINQLGKNYTFTNSFDTLHLSRDSFSIEFESKKYNYKKKLWYNTKIAAVTSDSIVLLMKPSQKLDNVLYFSSGSGIAAEEFGYTNLFFNNEGHHYITYTDKKDRRAELVSVKGEMVKLKWNIPLAYYNNQDFEFKNLPISNFSLIIFNDVNLNNVIDEGEYLVLYITLQ